jgi:hypothetical protein
MGAEKRVKKEKAIAEGKVKKVTAQLAAVKTPIPEETRSLSKVFNILAVLNPTVSNQIHSILNGDDCLVVIPAVGSTPLKPILLSTLNTVIEFMINKEMSLAAHTLKQTMDSSDALQWVRAITATNREGGYELISKRIQTINI